MFYILKILYYSFTNNHKIQNKSKELLFEEIVLIKNLKYIKYITNNISFNYYFIEILLVLFILNGIFMEKNYLGRLIIWLMII